MLNRVHRSPNHQLPRCLVREEVSDLSELGDSFKMLVVKDKLVEGAAAPAAMAMGRRC
eukprot:COSAG06_NODE_313_length_17764_cov_4.287235_6_plen_58_part_00